MVYIVILCIFTGGGVDYGGTDSKYEVTFPAGAICASLDIPINDDMISEKTEAFYVDILNLSLPLGVQLGDHSRTQVNIIDNDGEYLILIILCLWLHFIYDNFP